MTDEMLVRSAEESPWRAAEHGPNGKLMQTYVWHKGLCYFVSTIDRDSSAVLAPGRYAETMVWEYDFAVGKRLGLVSQGDAAQGSIRVHQDICETLFKGGLKALEPREPKYRVRHPNGSLVDVRADMVAPKAEEDCAHTLVMPESTLTVIDPYKAKCRVCYEFFDLPLVPTAQNGEPQV
jgi:hypothetical protein